MPLFITIVLDGVGIGEAPDAALYHDEGSDTLGHVCEIARPHLPHLTRLGLGNISILEAVPMVAQPLASYGRMQEVSAGKDSTTGHWELAGLVLDRPFPTYPQGFSPELLQQFCARTGIEGVLCNAPASGTAVLEAFGEAHLATGKPIVYTSADSVFQVAAHKDKIPLEDLYRLCKIAREEIFNETEPVARVIARPFIGSVAKGFKRIGAERKDFSLLPRRETLQGSLQKQGVRTIAIGKIGDLFGNMGFDEVHKTKNNEDGMAKTFAQIQKWAAETTPVFIWVNLVDFDQEFGHRNDVAGFAGALEAFDQWLPTLLASLPPDARLVLTADHGNDPATPSTDHSREYVPLLYYRPDQPSGLALGTRYGFGDHARTVSHYFGGNFYPEGKSFFG